MPPLERVFLVQLANQSIIRELSYQRSPLILQLFLSQCLCYRLFSPQLFHRISWLSCSFSLEQTLCNQDEDEGGKREIEAKGKRWLMKNLSFGFRNFSLFFQNKSAIKSWNLYLRHVGSSVHLNRIKANNDVAVI